MTKYTLTVVTLILVTGWVIGTLLVGEVKVQSHKRVALIEATLQE